MLLISAIIPSAGFGTRMGNVKKPYIELAGKPILAHTLEKFQQCQSVNNIIIVTAKGDEQRCANEIIESFNISKVIDIIAGGNTRQESVFNAIQKLIPDTDIVVIHDAVRPFLTEKMIIESIENASLYGSAIIAVPVKDTIKEANENKLVLKTLDRQKLWMIQTPQAFKYDIIKQAHIQAKNRNIQATDDASLVEFIGLDVKLVMGSYDNIKITTPDDLVVAKTILGTKTNI